jgi:hypothetical protein
MSAGKTANPSRKEFFQHMQTHCYGHQWEPLVHHWDQVPSRPSHRPLQWAPGVWWPLCGVGCPRCGTKARRGGRREQRAWWGDRVIQLLLHFLFSSWCQRGSEHLSICVVWFVLLDLLDLEQWLVITLSIRMHVRLCGLETFGCMCACGYLLSFCLCTLGCMDDSVRIFDGCCFCMSMKTPETPWFTPDYMEFPDSPDSGSVVTMGPDTSVSFTLYWVHELSYAFHIILFAPSQAPH